MEQRVITYKEEKKIHQTNQEVAVQKKNMIMCIGIGGGGSNIVNHMHQQGIKDVTLVVSNTDQQALCQSAIPIKLQLGPHTTQGLGAGCKPEIGEKAALESKEEINKLLTKQIKMVFITAGMGGGTGTGAAPVFASLAKEKDMLVIGVITFPFAFEAQEKRRIAEAGIRNLSQYCDTVIIIENQRLMEKELGAQDLLFKDAFRMVDQVLFEAVSSITDPINEPGVINVDFRDIDTMLRNSGNSVIGTGVAEGDDRGLKAVTAAMNSPLLRHRDVKGSTRLLLSIASGFEGGLTLYELSQITEYIKEILENENIMVIWGHSYAKELEDKIRVSIIASGFPEKKEDAKLAQDRGGESVDDYPAGGLNATPAMPLPSSAGVAQQSGTAHMRSASHYNYHQPTPTPAMGGPAQAVQAAAAEPLETPVDQIEKLADKVKIWQERAKNQAQNMDVSEDSQLTDREIKELLSVPAYKRKGVSLLRSTLPSPKQPVVRHQLNNE